MDAEHDEHEAAVDAEHDEAAVDAEHNEVVDVQKVDDTEVNTDDLGDAEDIDKVDAQKKTENAEREAGADAEHEAAVDAEHEEVTDIENAGKYWKTGLDSCGVVEAEAAELEDWKTGLDSCGVVEAEAAFPDSHDAKPPEHLREYEAWAAASAHHLGYFALTRSISSRPLAYNHPHCSSLHRSSARLQTMKAVSSPTQ